MDRMVGLSGKTLPKTRLFHTVIRKLAELTFNLSLLFKMF